MDNTETKKLLNKIKYHEAVKTGDPDDFKGGYSLDWKGKHYYGKDKMSILAEVEEEEYK